MKLIRRVLGKLRDKWNRYVYPEVTRYPGPKFRTWKNGEEEK